MGDEGKGQLRADANGHMIQCFAPNKFVEVVATEAWTPTEGDRVFVVPEGCSYTMDGESAAASLSAGALRGIHKKNYTFDTTMVIEVM